MRKMPIHWNWKDFAELSGAEVHAMLPARQQVFVIEQSCIYPDPDALDLEACHLLGISPAGELVAYARLTAPGTRFPEPSFGRVLCMPTARGQGLGRDAVRQCIEQSARLYPGQPVRISAQGYLQKWYGSFGFRAVGEPYDDAGIEHIDMVFTPGSSAQQT